MLRTIIPVAFLVLSCSSLLADRTLYVSTKGSDLNNGLSEKAPFLTISKAAELVQPGDIVIVKGGKYQEHIILNKSGTEEKPIVFRAAPNETVIVTWGWDIGNWKKVEGTRFCYESSFPYAINMLWERKKLGMYLEVNNMDLLDKQPGGFVFDKKTGKIFVHTFDCGNPEFSGIVAVPYSDGKKPISFSSDTSKAYKWNKGFAVKGGGSYNIVEGFELSFHSIGIQIRDEAKKCIARNNTVYGTATGVATYNTAGGHLLENNRAYWNSGAGINIEGKNNDITVKNNFLLNNGHSPPFTGADAGSGGHPYNLALYGGPVVNISFIGNTVISDDPSRRVGVMRCKGGITGTFDLANNVLVGGSTDFYAQPDSKSIMKNNTVIEGDLRYAKDTTDAREYKPELKANISLKDNNQKPCFADPSFYDYRLRKDSPFIGSGAYPEAGQILYVDGALKTEGDGSTPEKAFKSLSAAFRKTAAGGCIYILPGIYKENLSLAKLGGDKNISVRNYGKGKVVFENSQMDLKDCRNVTIDGIIFKNSKIQVQNSNDMEFIHCIFDGPESGMRAENCGIVKVVNNTFAGNTLSASILKAQLILKNNLFMDCKAFPVKSEALKTISENNVFAGGNAEKLLTEWKSKYNETIPSFADNVKLDNNYALPDDTKLAFSGLGWSPIGACGAEKKSRPVIVENIKAINVLSDRAILQWETPFDYPDVRIIGKDKSGKTICNIPVNQGMYKQTVNSECISGLNPDSQYNITLIFTNPGGTDKTEKTLTVTTTEKKVFQPKNIYVSKTGDDSKNGLSANDAKKSIYGALCLALPGDTILVAPGIYTEQNKIFIDGLSKEKPLVIKSEKPGKAIINSNYIFNTGLSIYNGKYITIDGFKFSGLRYSATVTALDIFKSDGIIIKNCIFDRDRRKNGCSNVQLKCVDVNNIEISNCIFDNGFHGIWMSNSNNNVKIFNNIFWHIGINGIHVGCAKDYNVDIYNNIFMDVVGNHNSPAVSVGARGEKILCDYNIYWKTDAVCPGQKTYGVGGGSGYSAPWHVLKKDIAETIEDARKMYGVEKNGQFTDPLFKDPQNDDFSVKPGSPAIGKGRNGSNIGVDMNVFLK